MSKCQYVWILLCCLVLSACSHDPKKKKKIAQSMDLLAAFSPISFEKNHKIFEKQSATKLARKKNKKRSNKAAEDYVREHEAKLTDIPVPLQVQPLNHYFDEYDASDGVVFGYSSTMPHEDIIDFYQQEMERLGWKQSACCLGAESLLNFEKPTRFCTVSIRPGGKKWGKKNPIIVMYAGNKQSG